jgi:hypothetical protein
VLDRRLVEDAANRLDADPGLVEKDWHVTRAIGVLASLDHGGAIPAFGGGTSLSKAWGLIRRFSEDIDFKVAMPEGLSRNKAKATRSAYRKRIFAGLAEAGFVPMGEPYVRDENRFFSAAFTFPSLFDAGHGLRPHIQIEMSLEAATMPTAVRAIGSLINQVRNLPAEILSFRCVNPVETAADKLSALAWRVHARRRGSDGDDPTIVRHLHDLAALRSSATASSEFARLVLAALATDRGRGGDAVPSAEPAALFAGMLEKIESDPLWAEEYERFVEAVSFAAINERVGFAASLDAVRELIAHLGGEFGGGDRWH